MVKELVEQGYLNNISADLIEQAFTLFDQFKEDEYKDELQLLIEKQDHVANINPEVLELVDSELDTISESLGMYYNEDILIRDKLDILEALYLIGNLDDILKQGLLEEINYDEADIDILESILSEYLKTNVNVIFSIERLEKDFLSNIITILKDNKIDTDDLFKINKIDKYLNSIFTLDHEDINFFHRLREHYGSSLTDIYKLYDKKYKDYSALLYGTAMALYSHDRDNFGIIKYVFEYNDEIKLGIIEKVKGFKND